jgi:hypothetical protein
MLRRWQRDVHDGGIQHHHELGDGHHHKDQPSTVTSRRGAALRFAGTRWSGGLSHVTSVRAIV